jgi:hypothetical protein
MNVAYHRQVMHDIAQGGGFDQQNAGHAFVTIIGLHYILPKAS